MSAILFHQRDAPDVRLRGAERFWYGHVLESIAYSFIPNHARGIDYDPKQFAMKLNTALRLGNEFVRWMARVHGQCEIFAWIHGDDREFFADLLERGCREGLFRHKLEKADMGYTTLITSLRCYSGPVVMSYSVTERFPSNTVDGISAEYEHGSFDDEESEEWNNLTDEQRWDVAFLALSNNDHKLRIEPAHITTDCYRFGSGDDFLDAPKKPKKKKKPV